MTVLVVDGTPTLVVRAMLRLSQLRGLLAPESAGRAASLQFRMHPAIAEFPAAQWYDRALANGVGPEQRIAPRGLHWPDPLQPVAFVNVGGDGSRQLETKSFR